jgi:hypothetical protein
MKECLNCGYVRQPKDDEFGIVPPTECPRCGIIYDKITDSGNKPLSTLKSHHEKRSDKSAPGSANKTARYIVGAFIGIFVVIAAIHAAPYLKKTAIGKLFQDKTQVGGWYMNAQGYDLAVTEFNKIAKPLLLYFYGSG